MTSTGTATCSDLRGSKAGSSAFRFVRDLVIIFVVAILISALLKTFVVRSFHIPSTSMEATLLIDDRIIVNELVPNLISLEHGDVVVFTDPGNWLSPNSRRPSAWRVSPMPR
jgi:signal peptidase I